MQSCCACKRDCAKNIDSIMQKKIFDMYTCPNWTEKSLFLRSLVQNLPVEDNLNPINALSKRQFSSKYFLSDSNG